MMTKPGLRKFEILALSYSRGIILQNENII